MSDTITIDKSLQLPVAEDYYQLREDAIDALQEVATENWTDFNLHDPGITFMELFAYGITDLGYRQNMPIENLLTVDLNNGINNEVQALYTPNEILTINPWTINDYRKLLIDIPGVKNAWLSVACNVPESCGTTLYVDCQNSTLVYTPTPAGQFSPPVQYQGLYNVLVELEDDTTLGDLNSGSIIYRFTFPQNASLNPSGSSNSSISSSTSGSGLTTGQSIAADTIWYNAFIEVRLPSLDDITGNSAYSDLLQNSNSQILYIAGPVGYASASVTFNDSISAGDTIAFSVNGVPLLTVPYVVQTTDTTPAILASNIVPLIQAGFTGAIPASSASSVIITAQTPGSVLNNYSLVTVTTPTSASIVNNTNIQFSGGADIPVTFYEDAACTIQVYDANFQAAAQNILYTTFIVIFSVNGSPDFQHPLVMTGIPVKIYFYESGGRANLTLEGLQNAMEDKSTAGIVSLYMNKLQTASGVMNAVTDALQSHRNLCEDFCSITTADTEDFAICCDVDAAPDADLEQVQAEIYYTIMSYMNPPLNFYTWEQLQAQGLAIDQIFNGPQVSSGFITDADLNNSSVKTVLYVADLIDLILNNVSGVVAVRSFSISRIGPAGNVIETQPWQITVTPSFLPEFYLYGSSIQFYKNSLPFATDFFELSDILALLVASNEKPKLSQYQIDVPVPLGTYVGVNNYYPLMYSLPQVYNVSQAGPMPPFSSTRYAQANQLQAYLLLYDQIYANWIQQIGDLKNFFNVQNPALPTYSTYVVGESDISGVSTLFDNTSTYPQKIQNINEMPLSKGFYYRKNRIFNHLLSRLGENNEDYLLINNTVSSPLLQPDSTVIEEKATLISDYPTTSYNKAKSINYLQDLTPLAGFFNEGLVGKLKVLLGLKNWDDYLLWMAPVVVLPGNNLPPNTYQLALDFTAQQGPLIIFQIFQTFTVLPSKYSFEPHLPQVFWGTVTMLDSFLSSGIQQPGNTGSYYVMGGTNSMVDGSSQFVEICRLDTSYTTYQLAETALNNTNDFMRVFLSQSLLMPIEHILLRPTTQTESLFNICVPKNCQFCGDEDPYSFRMTVLMCGGNGFPGYDLDYRAYAEDLIRSEVPAHILLKVCWISAEDFGQFFGLLQNYLTIIQNPSQYGGESLVISVRSELVTTLNNMRSVYPPATLADCAVEGSANMVILGKTVI